MQLGTKWNGNLVGVSGVLSYPGFELTELYYVHLMNGMLWSVNQFLLSI